VTYYCIRNQFLVSQSLVFINFAVFATWAIMYQVSPQSGVEAFIELGFRPMYLESPELRLITLISAMFMHGGPMHLLINMLILILLGVPFEEPERPVFVEPTEEKVVGFDFNSHLRETRLEVESLLSDGLVLEAENYMEKRKNEINSNGYNIRKINQAYFAFHGSYGSSPSSISPVANYLWDLREQTKTIGELVHIMEDISNYGEFEQVLLNRDITVFYNN